ncbi:hypothetical protein KI387_041852, partial [Taxus chinensis]
MENRKIGQGQTPKARLYAGTVESRLGMQRRTVAKLWDKKKQQEENKEAKCGNRI